MTPKKKSKPRRKTYTPKDPNDRIIDGKTYSLRWLTTTKREAQSIAKNMRKNGFQARVVPKIVGRGKHAGKKNYGVFKHNPKRKKKSR